MSVVKHIDNVEVKVNAGITYEPAACVQIYALLLRVGDVIVGTSRDCAHVGGDATNQNDFVVVNGLTFKFVIVAVKVTVNVSATLIVLSNQFTYMLTELNVINAVLPPLYAVKDIV